MNCLAACTGCLHWLLALAACTQYWLLGKLQGLGGGQRPAGAADSGVLLPMPRAEAVRRAAPSPTLPLPCTNPLACRLFVRKRTATATVEGRPGRPACLVLSGFRGHAPAGTWGRLSTFWPGQWHPFAVVSPPRREEGGSSHSMLIAPAGDWTKARIEEAQAANGTQRKYYVRLLRAPGEGPGDGLVMRGRKQGSGQGDLS